jgi:ABC-type proline/glycine betaine transport system ATPase subunit
MFDEKEFEEAVRTVINNVMLALYHQGITHINLGGLMRIVGVANDKAARYDNDVVVMDSDFVDYIESPRPPDQLLH